MPGYERTYVTGRLTSTVGEGNWLKRIHANNFFCCDRGVRGEGRVSGWRGKLRMPFIY